MYEPFFGLSERPFELTPNPRYLLLTRQHREALANLEYGISTHRGMTLLLGEAGTGKTTLIRTALAAQQGGQHCWVTLNNPLLTRSEFFAFLADKFELSEEASASKLKCVKELEHVLRSRWERGFATTLVIDEAQSLPPELLEEVRLLANIETDTAKLLSLVLVGQPEFADRLNQTEFRQFKQRVALRYTLRPLDRQQVAAYIAERVRIAGGDGGQLFSREAVETIYDAAGGIPRMVNVICDNALAGGFAVGRRPVNRQIVLEVCEDFDIDAVPVTDGDKTRPVALTAQGEP